jgi:hypothetical protein
MVSKNSIVRNYTIPVYFLDFNRWDREKAGNKTFKRRVKKIKDDFRDAANRFAEYISNKHIENLDAEAREYGDKRLSENQKKKFRNATNYYFKISISKCDWRVFSRISPYENSTEECLKAENLVFCLVAENTPSHIIRDNGQTMVWAPTKKISLPYGDDSHMFFIPSKTGALVAISSNANALIISQGTELATAVDKQSEPKRKLQRRENMAASHEDALYDIRRVPTERLGLSATAAEIRLGFRSHDGRKLPSPRYVELGDSITASQDENSARSLIKSRSGKGKGREAPYRHRLATTVLSAGGHERR